MKRSAPVGKSTSPSHGNSFSSLGGADYIIGTVFILAGILIYFFFNKKAKKNMADYKARQLELYNKNRGTKITDYSRTSLYIPFWQKAKFTAPIMLTVLFMIIGFFWIIWTATGTPVSTL